MPRLTVAVRLANVRETQRTVGVVLARLYRRFAPAYPFCTCQVGPDATR